MVMMLERLKERGLAKRQFRRPNLDLVPEDKYERIEIRDYDYDTGDSATWHGRVSAKELYQNLPTESRIEPDYMIWRKVWGLLAGMCVFFVVWGLLVLLVGPIHSLFPAIMLSSGAAIVGWWNGSKFTPNNDPFWVARRLWINGVPHIQPIVHTMLLGEPNAEEAALQANGKKNGHSPAVLQEGEELVQGPPVIGGNGHREPFQVAGFDAIPDGTYVPVVYRATTLYQDLQMVEERQDMKMPVDRWQQIKLGGMILFGGILIVGLIFVMAVTSNNA